MTRIVPRSNARQMNRALLLMACAHSVQIVADDIPERIDAAGIGDDLAQVREALEDCSVKLIATFPPEKQPAMMNLFHRLYINLDTMTTPADGYTNVKTSTFDTLVQSAHENCKICVNPDRCYRCKLGKALDRSTPEERQKGESWADIWV